MVFKFVPTKNRIIYEWYDRLMWQEKLRKDITLVDTVKNIYRIDYLVSKQYFTLPSLIKIREFGDYNIYEVQWNHEN